MDKRLLLVLFLSVLMAGMSHQQQHYRYQLENPRSLWVPELPVPPSFARRMMAFLYSNYPIPDYNDFYSDNLGALMSPSSQQEGDPVEMESNNEESSAAQPRRKLNGNRYNIKPSASKTQQEQHQRFAFPFRQTLLEPAIQTTSMYSNTMRTATFTLTLNVTTAIITTCIPVAAFAAGPPLGQNVICTGRKRRDIEEVEPDGDEDLLADLAPSRVEVMIATVDPNSVTNEYEGHLYGHVHSSKEENELIGEVDDASSVQRDKRFFFDGLKNVYGYYPVTTTTVTSYAFASTTCTQQLQFAAAVLACRPSQFNVCP